MQHNAPPYQDGYNNISNNPNFNNDTTNGINYNRNNYHGHNYYNDSNQHEVPHTHNQDNYEIDAQRNKLNKRNQYALDLEKQIYICVFLLKMT